jgi:hypothetical protein
MTRQVITTSDGNCSAYTAIVINILVGLTTLTTTRSCHVVWGGAANDAFSAPRIRKTNILRHIHPCTIYPCKDKINLIKNSKLNYCHYASIRKAKRLLVFKQNIAAYCSEN